MRKFVVDTDRIQGTVLTELVLVTFSFESMIYFWKSFFKLENSDNIVKRRGIQGDLEIDT